MLKFSGVCFFRSFFRWLCGVLCIRTRVSTFFKCANLSTWPISPYAIGWESDETASVRAFLVRCVWCWCLYCCRSHILWFFNRSRTTNIGGDRDFVVVDRFLSYALPMHVIRRKLFHNIVKASKSPTNFDVDICRMCLIFIYKMRYQCGLVFFPLKICVPIPKMGKKTEHAIETGKTN